MADDDDRQDKRRTPKTPTKRSERDPELLWPGVPTDTEEESRD